MGEEREEAQKLKRIAAAAYDYDNGPRWADYWSNIFIPPHIKRKFYQRYIDTECRQANHHNPQNLLLHPQLHHQQQMMEFDLTMQVFIVAVLSIFPLVPRSLSYRAYRLSFVGTACSCLYSLYALYGKPRAWNLQAVQVYFQSIVATKDVIYLIYCLTFVTSHLFLKFALIPIICRTLEHITKFLRRNFNRSTFYKKYLEDPCLWVESNKTTMDILSSHAEIGVGFLLIVSLLLWQRNIIQTFMYWQLLKLMYHAPVSAEYHQGVWAKIGTTVNPLVQCYAPFLNTPVSAIQRWWF